MLHVILLNTVNRVHPYLCYYETHRPGKPESMLIDIGSITNYDALNLASIKSFISNSPIGK